MQSTQPAASIRAFHVQDLLLLRHNAPDPRWCVLQMTLTTAGL